MSLLFVFNFAKPVAAYNKHIIGNTLFVIAYDVYNIACVYFIILKVLSYHRRFHILSHIVLIPHFYVIIMLDSMSVTA